jgi:hypothetical protein
VTWAAVGLVLLAALDAAAADGAVRWTTVAASGTVQAQDGTPSGAWARVQRGQELDGGTVVRTGSNGRATVVHDGTILILDRDSTLRLPGDPAEDALTAVQSAGTVRYQVERRPSRHFQVRTPYLVAGVKGTVFEVRSGAGGASVTVHEGLVEVRSRTAEEVAEIGAGEVLSHDGTAMRHGTLALSDDERPGRERGVRRAERDRTGDRGRSDERDAAGSGPTSRERSGEELVRAERDGGDESVHADDHARDEDWAGTGPDLEEDDRGSLSRDDDQDEREDDDARRHGRDADEEPRDADPGDGSSDGGRRGR